MPAKPTAPARAVPRNRGTAYRRRVAGTMLLAYGGLALGGVLLLPDVANQGVLAATAGCAVALGLLLTIRPQAAPEWTSQMLIGFVMVLITVGIAAGGPGSAASNLPVLYVPTAVYIFYFFSPRQGFAQVAFASSAYAVCLVLTGYSATVGVALWLSATAGMLVSGLMLRAMNRQVDSLVAELDATAARDPLTGVLNRRGLDERLGIELTRARRTGEPLTVIACDLDNLKSVNDEHGHSAGDEALALAADVLGSGLRDVDVLARTGGDEFLLLLPNCDMESGLRIAEQLREQVRATSESESWPTSASMGVACAPPLPLDPDAVTEAADLALYRSKSLGRDRVSRAGRNELRSALGNP